MESRRNFVHRLLCGSVATACLGVRSSRAQDVNPEETAVEFITPAAQKAIDDGLAFLAKQQTEDGSFGSSSAGYSRNVAVCSLAGMAFMSGGSTPSRGPYGIEVERCVDYVLSGAEASGFITIANAQSHGPMYGHGFATLFLAEAFGMTGREDVRDKLAKAVSLIVNTQNDAGGWRYQPQRRDSDISVTISQMMALRAARNAGIFVPPATIDQGVEYVKRSQNPDGGFAYMVEGGPSAFPRSAAGIVGLFSAGVYEGKEIDTGIAYLMQHLPRAGSFNRESHYFYGHYYAVQAMWHYGGDAWRQWYPAIRDELIDLQRSDGSWTDSICREYGTAMACVILQIPNNYLPIFHR